MSNVKETMQDAEFEIKVNGEWYTIQGTIEWIEGRFDNTWFQVDIDSITKDGVETDWYDAGWDGDYENEIAEAAEEYFWANILEA